MSENPFRSAVMRAVGTGADVLMPGLWREIENGQNHGNAPRLKRAIIHARTQRAHDRGDDTALAETLKNYWRDSFGDRFHAMNNASRIERFIRQHAGILEALQSTMDASGGDFARLVEIGCGDGLVLSHAAGRFPEVRELIGIDINSSAISLARDRDDDNRLRFVLGDALDWLESNPEPRTAVLTNGGVLEYFTEAQLDRLLRLLRRNAPTAIACVEPIDPAHDIDGQPASYPFGIERSFSHNYPIRLRAAGFEVTHQSIEPEAGIRWILISGGIGNDA